MNTVRKMCHSQKNRSQLEKCVRVRTINTVRKMGHSQKKMGHSQKNGSQLEKMNAVSKMCHS